MGTSVAIMLCPHNIEKSGIRHTESLMCDEINKIKYCQKNKVLGTSGETIQQDEHETEDDNLRTFN